MGTIRKEHSVGLIHFAKGSKTLPKLTHSYLPELHRQGTERMPVSRLGYELNQFCRTGLGEAFDSAAIAQARLELSELLEKISMPLKSSRMGLEMLTPVPVHCFPHWQVQPETRVVCLLPVNIHSAKCVQKDVGHIFLKVTPPAFKPDSQENTASPRNRHTDILSQDGEHVSPRKVLKMYARLVAGSLLKHGVTRDKVTVNLSAGNLDLSVLLDCGWNAELVPCVAAPGGESNLYYVARRFTSETYVKGDVAWRPCTAVTEQQLLHSTISSADGGMRVLAMHVVCRLLLHDWRLANFTCYDVQTALLHDMDVHVDYSPRWQRSTLESCVISLLSSLLYFAQRESLPHFGLNRLNLWEDKTHRQFTNARGAITRLLANENAFISLLCRASGNRGVVSVDFGPEVT